VPCSPSFWQETTNARSTLGQEKRALPDLKTARTCAEWIKEKSLLLDSGGWGGPCMFADSVWTPGYRPGEEPKSLPTPRWSKKKAKKTGKSECLRASLSVPQQTNNPAEGDRRGRQKSQLLIPSLRDLCRCSRETDGAEMQSILT